MRKIVHCYFTDGMYKWGKLFVESLKFSNGEKYELILSTRNLSKNKINDLYNLYSNLTIINKDLNYDNLAKKAKISKNTLMNYKEKVEKNKVDMQSKVWKLMIAGEDRIKEVREVVRSVNDGDLIMHFDVDSYIRNSIDPWFKIIEEHDYTGIINVKKQREAGKIKPLCAIIICFQGYNVNEKSKKFLDTWIAEIDSKPAPERPRTFGQISAWYAYRKIENELRWGDIPKVDIAIGKGGGDAILWGACIGSKEDNLKKFNNDFKNLKNLRVK